VPWALLSGGAAFDLFLKQATAACRAGASGVIAGRAVWAEAVALDGDARDAFVRDVVGPRLERLRAVCRQEARPWMEKVQPPRVEEGWYRDRRP
jgi:tagatose 1,6-diphosphate aldolase